MSIGPLNFAWPEMLVLVAIVPIAGLWWTYLRARREKALSKITLRSSTSTYNFASKLQSVAILLGLALCLFAASRPRWGKSDQIRLSRSRNVVVAVDVSRSMLAEDVRPSRLERVKADVANLIDELGSDRCALVAFRRTGVLICPLTTDHGFLRSALEAMTPDSAEKGETDLGSAIRAALSALDPAADDHNAIILISDGGDLRGEALEAAALARQRGVPIFTVGIGDPNRAVTIPSEDGRGVMKYNGADVTVKLEEETLRKIAEASGGRYVPFATAGTIETKLGGIYRDFLRQVAALEQMEEESRLVERYQVFLLPGLACLILGAALSKGRFRKTREC